MCDAGKRVYREKKRPKMAQGWKGCSSARRKKKTEDENFLGEYEQQHLGGEEDPSYKGGPEAKG